MIPIADGVYYVDHSADPDFTPGSFKSIYPENCSFDHMIRGVGNISYEISFAAKDADGATVVTGHDFIGPYRTYWRLRFGNVVILAGVITGTHTKLGDDFMSVAGKTWEHLWERWQYPFDPRVTPHDAADHVNDYQHPFTYVGDALTGTGVSTPRSLAYQATNRDVIRIWSDLFSTAMNVTPGTRVIFDISDLAGLSGVKVPTYNLALGDDTTMMAIIDDLAGTGHGFDWWSGWDRQVHWGSPYRYGNMHAPSIFFTITNTTKLENLEFGNNGPRATHVFGKGSGFAVSTKLGRALGIDVNQSLTTGHGRMDASYDFGDVRNFNQLLAMTQKQLALDVQPEHEIALSIDPATISTYWTDFRTGRAIYITREMVSHAIDSGQQLISFQASLNKEGDCKVDWTLKQIYDYTLAAGTPEG